MAYLSVILWGACIAVACVGYGKLTLRCLRCGEGSWSIASALGVGVLIVLGGVLNLGHALKRPVLLGTVVLGVLLAAVAILSEWTQLRRSIGNLTSFWPKRRWVAVLGLVIVLLIVGRAAISSYTYNFNDADDYNAYLAFPLKMLASGDFAADPFSERRVTSSLGGSVYLQALQLAGHNDLRAINLPDGTLGLLLFAATCVALCGEAGLSADRALWVFLVFALTPDYRVNTTFVVLPAALILGALLIAATPIFGSPLSLRRYFALGLTLAAACTLKSTVIPGIVLICGALLFFELLEVRNSQVFRAGLVLAGTGLAALAPWMIDSRIKSGTALYPILGRGYHFTAYSNLPPIPAGSFLPIAVKVAIVSVPYLLTAILVLMFPKDRPGVFRIPLLGVLIGIGLGNIALCYATGGDSIPRYTITMGWPANVFIAMSLLAASWPRHRGDVLGFTRSLSAAWVAGSLVFAVVQGFSYSANGKGAFAPWTMSFRSPANRRPLWTAGVRKEATDLQAAIPPGALLMTHTTRAYTANFKRNPVWIADFPGMASLPPGMPIGPGPEPLANYLLRHSVRYVAYSYYDEAGFPRAYFYKAIRTWTQQAWARQEIATTLEFQDNLAALAKTRCHLFDDGRVYVLDLANRCESPAVKPSGPSSDPK